jgi:hypothetical protein
VDSVLVLEAAAQAELDRIAAYAERRRNWIDVDGAPRVAGHDPGHVARVMRLPAGFYTVIYSIDVNNDQVDDGRPYRHLSVAVWTEGLPGPARRPPPATLEVLAEALGWPEPGVAERLIYQGSAAVDYALHRIQTYAQPRLYAPNGQILGRERRARTLVTR